MAPAPHCGRMTGNPEVMGRIIGWISRNADQTGDTGLKAGLGFSCASGVAAGPGGERTATSPGFIHSTVDSTHGKRTAERQDSKKWTFSETGVGKDANMLVSRWLLSIVAIWDSHRDMDR
jgi:hypothetical protein